MKLLTPLLLTVLILHVSCQKDEDNKQTVTDINGNVYHTVTIGTQVWMVENLKTTKSNDGTPIPLVTDGAAWGALDTPGYCWYNNDELATKATYGALYNWPAAVNACPAGWHVPSDDEWTELTDYLGGDDVAGGKLKEVGLTHWNGPNEGATNESGFTALPGGYRYDGGTFSYVGYYGSWWSATESGASGAWGRSVFYSGVGVYRNDYYKEVGFSVRCVRD